MEPSGVARPAWPKPGYADVTKIDRPAPAEELRSR